MIEWLRQIFRRITGISTPFGGINWSPSATSLSKVPIFRGSIYITSPDNHELISFLGANDGKIVFLDTHIDASVSLKEQFELIEKEDIDISLIASGEFSGAALHLPNKQDSFITATFYFNDDHVLKSSSGGTGIVTVKIRGFFDITQTFSGSSTAFHLKEVKTSLEAKVDMLNR
jgi:hypothetical protein